MDASTSTLAPSQRLRVAYVLTLVGGYLDAYTYVMRGGVFANAQTGNIVKLGIAIENGARESYLTFLIPIISFAAGIFAALYLERHLTKRGIRFVRRSVLVIEMLALVAVGLIPLGTEWDMAANCVVSFVAAMQFEAFKTFHGEAIATTMSTGNLRKFMDNLFAAVVDGDNRKLNNAATYLTIILTFVLGAFLGARCSDLMGRASVCPAIVGLGAATVTITVLKRHAHHDD